MPVDKSSDRVRRMFGQIAGRYDFLNHLLSLGIDRYWRWRTVRLVPPHGTAADSRRVHRHRRPGAGVRSRGRRQDADRRRRFLPRDAGDRPAESAAGRGRRRASRSSRPTPSRCRCRATRFKSSAWRSACATWPTPTAAWPKWRASLRPGGRVAVLEFSTPTWQPFKAVYGWYFRNVLPRIGQIVRAQSGDAYEYLPTSVGEFPQGEALAERMRAAGLDRRPPLPAHIRRGYTVCRDES